jgi:hypothetical protein
VRACRRESCISYENSLLFCACVRAWACLILLQCRIALFGIALFA